MNHEIDFTWHVNTVQQWNLAKLFSKMYLLFYAEAFDDTMKFEYLKF